ncbi:hypothetical protein B0H10DRAFT_1752016, partial [Mycena sp. CBHHK59/15]
NILMALGDLDRVRNLEFGRRWYVPEETLPMLLVHELFEACVRESPSAIALEFEGMSTLTYGELDHLSTDLAVDLHNNYGVEANVMVPLLFDLSFEMIVAILAIMKAGGAYMPIGSDLPQ